ncbi:hypothetical protein INT44_003198 [Umbelopsis vinacea]|uniref:HNH domain-containing protein n=1 Tax=Umbelopsis vinacea TaxID=44442 RepID=A0A8H7Q7J0_9FUNG|nr:hypothetical protein INT44_003198 [Umbelopsis vinacea]
MADKELPMPSRQKDLYDNWKVYSQIDKLMFRCSKKKADWYLCRNLAALLPEDKAIKLSFVAKGDGHAEGDYMVEDKANICVSCGTSKALTLHHIIPDMYRKWMPEVIKSKSSRDLVVLCKNCHLKYEQQADKYKECFATEYNMPLEGRGWILTPDNSIVRKAASAVVKYRDGKLPLIPLDRIQHLHKVVDDWQIEQEMSGTKDEVLECALQLTDRHKGDDYVDHGQYVVAQLMENAMVIQNNRTRWPDLEEFVKNWRRHFLKYCDCDYLSDKWSVDADIYVE